MAVKLFDCEFGNPRWIVNPGLTNPNDRLNDQLCQGIIALSKAESSQCFLIGCDKALNVLRTERRFFKQPVDRHGPLWSNSRTPFRHGKRYKRRDQSKSRLSDLQRVPTIGQYILANASLTQPSKFRHTTVSPFAPVCQTRSRRAVIVLRNFLICVRQNMISEELGAKAALRISWCNLAV